MARNNPKKEKAVKKRKAADKSPLKPAQWGWNPLAGQETLKLAMGEMLSELFGSGGDEASSLWHPRADLYEYGNSLFIEVALPGVGRDRLEIHATGDLLIIKGETGGAKEGMKYYLAELPKGQFTRAIALPHKVDPAKIKARLEQGLLKIRLPISKRKEFEQSVKIQVEEA
ncbi:MAG: Hsp20/alpha crystallin family protein [Chloroflexi bacterium]|nr:Hsp20/alpha crystallin family protein [Chloroflexota bacterium]